MRLAQDLSNDCKHHTPPDAVGLWVLRAMHLHANVYISCLEPIISTVLNRHFLMHGTENKPNACLSRCPNMTPIQQNEDEVKTSANRLDTFQDWEERNKLQA